MSQPEIEELVASSSSSAFSATNRSNRYRPKEGRERERAVQLFKEEESLRLWLAPGGHQKKEAAMG